MPVISFTLLAVVAWTFMSESSPEDVADTKHARTTADSLICQLYWTNDGHECPSDIRFPCLVAVVFLLESLPIMGGIQSPLLLKRAVPDGRLNAVQRATVRRRR